MKRSELRRQFAWQLLYLEVEFEMKGWLKLASINALVSLYTEAIGHFESHGDERYLYFKRKLEALLKHGAVINVLEGGARDGFVIGENSPVVRKERMKQDLLQKTKQAESFTVKELISSEKKIAEQISQQSLEQQGQLLSRLQERRRRGEAKRMSKSMSSPEFLEQKPETAISEEDRRAIMMKLIREEDEDDTDSTALGADGLGSDPRTDDIEE